MFFVDDSFPFFFCVCFAVWKCPLWHVVGATNVSPSFLEGTREMTHNFSSSPPFVLLESVFFGTSSCVFGFSCLPPPPPPPSSSPSFLFGEGLFSVGHSQISF